MIGSVGKIRLGSPPDHRSFLLASITRRQYLNTSWLVGSPDPAGAVLASSSRAIVHRFSPRFTSCGSFGWASSPDPCREPALPEPLELFPPPVPLSRPAAPPDGGASLAAEGAPATGNP
jgi:hypothetical protein